MTSTLDILVLTFCILIIAIHLLRFFDVTLYQCRKFGNCPPYLEWMKDK